MGSGRVEAEFPERAPSAHEAVARKRKDTLKAVWERGDLLGELDEARLQDSEEVWVVADEEAVELGLLCPGDDVEEESLHLDAELSGSVEVGEHLGVSVCVEEVVGAYGAGGLVVHDDEAVWGLGYEVEHPNEVCWAYLDVEGGFGSEDDPGLVFG